MNGNLQNSNANSCRAHFRFSRRTPMRLSKNTFALLVEISTLRSTLTARRLSASLLFCFVVYLPRRFCMRAIARYYISHVPYRVDLAVPHYLLPLRELPPLVPPARIKRALFVPFARTFPLSLSLSLSFSFSIVPFCHRSLTWKIVFWVTGEIFLDRL